LTGPILDTTEPAWAFDTRGGESITLVGNNLGVPSYDFKGCFGEQARFSERPSKKGNYVAFTIEEVVSSAEVVFERYEQAGKISGIMSL
jgi:hypothetical protein